jgi:hypothetical protein
MASTTIRHVRSRGSAAVVIATGAVTVAYFVLSIANQSYVADAVALAAAAAMGVAVARHRPDPLVAWVLLALGTLLLAGGDILYGTQQPVPSPADMLYISAYPLLGLGVVALARSTIRIRREPMFAEAVLVAAAIAVIAMVFLIVPAGQRDGAGAATKAVAVGYPLMDLGLLAIVVRPLRSDGRRRAAFALLAIGIGLRLVADVIYLFSDFGFAYSVGNPADAAWLLSYGFVAAAALHPSLAERTVRSGPSVATEATTPVRITNRNDAQAIRLREILSLAGMMLLGLAVVALFPATSWRSADLVLLAGTYGSIGGLLLLTSLVRA